MSMIKKLIKKIKASKKGSAEIVAFAILLIFIIVAASTPVKNLGQTVVSGVNSTQTQVNDALTKQP